ncbi:hypothetical protein C3747_76g223 [Trypanosoma cruzi]|uniref:Uncharacterized protein n=2 Tax=Trypanosoma cruzi TaxID=5693 RepID=Q4DD78_TRYCC|nr:hypothetical protein, conserved [Trypanosoma cruzi]EAN90477.1 hypothetical protein, conserved [Trypanosoma cruzi]PWV09647.1 hypothetical protein C3747_76g223 [Trypanosoma cruzi]RNC48349.1 hypothetical protein TcCL_NonESM01765 [Trypanosoma cruzi]|eukprot:XP_812328.1 hypothetical protein [Trypanosoma cruzi strain CL Brener]
MELANALTAAPTPIVRAIFLMMSAMHGGEAGDRKRWTCCHANGTTAENLSATEGWQTLRKESERTPSMVEMHYRVGDTGDNNVKVKWVPMDDTHLVLILQNESGTAELRQPVSISICTEEEPLVSYLRGSIEWTVEKAETAVTQLRPALYEIIEEQQQRSCSSNKNNNNNGGGGGGNETMGFTTQTQRQGYESRQEYIPDAPFLAEPRGVTKPLFAEMGPRPPGFRYGEGDLVPGGSLSPEGVSSGGMKLDPKAFHGTGAIPCRYDPMFPGDVPRGGGMWGPGPGRVFPGEPDPDNFAPPGNPAFRMGFGPGAAGGRGGFGGGLPPFP